MSAGSVPCNKCGKPVPADHDACPTCGAPVAAGGFVPIVVVSDVEGTTVFGSVGAQQMPENGKEKFREIEKKFKASQDQGGKDKEKDKE